MNLHTADISQRLKRFLARRQAPKRVEGKPEAERDEVAALVGVIERNAPRGDALADWWPKFEAALGEAGTGLWPTEREAKDAAAAINRSLPKIKKPGGDTLGRYDVIGRRMAVGEAVGECYLYGSEACELIARGLVALDVMTRYRSAAYLSKRGLYGAEAADLWEADAKARHEAAKAARREKTPYGGPVATPDLRSPAANMGYV